MDAEIEKPHQKHKHKQKPKHKQKQKQKNVEENEANGEKIKRKNVVLTEADKEKLKQKNPKAFTFNSAIKAERRFRRKQDIETKKQHIPIVDRTPLEPPPILVAIVGPPKVGKSLLIQCLIKSYVKQPLTNIVGPVTVVSGKKHRITFMECNNDINSMIDIAKVADLVLLLIDASFGFEMEVFEFLNICQVHGMPRIMGVLTHLDSFKNSKQLRKTKKILKQRFWTEVYAGAKLFYLSGLLHDEYLRTEIKNLARFISVMKFRPLTWRTTHPYILADRIEDLTPPESIRQNPKIDRSISLYGYVRGIPLPKGTWIHIPGCGDFKIENISFLPDPCPLPEQIKKRALVEKERLIYAPFSGVGGIVYDKDAVYVELGGSHSHKEEDTGLIGALMETQKTLDQKLQHSELQLFSDAAPIKSEDVTEEFDGNYKAEIINDNGRVRRKVIFDDSKKLFDITENRDKDESESENEDENEDENEGDENENTDDDEDGNMESDDEDSNDETDNDDETEEMQKGKGIKRKAISLQSANDTAKKRKNSEEDLILQKEKVSNENQTQQAEVYHSLSKEKDIEIKNKITKALNMLDTKSKKSLNVDTDDESFDELSDDDSRMKLEMDNSEGEDTDENDDEEDEENVEEGEDSEGNKDLKEDEEEEEESRDELKWKTNLIDKAREAFLDRQQNSKNLMKLVYGSYSENNNIMQEDKKEAEDVGGIFRVVQEQQKQKLQERELKNQDESVFFPENSPYNCLKEINKALLINRFVTGKWKESEDAEELLKLDDLDDDELYGDFEDLETGEKHTTAAPKELPADETEERKKLLEKKRKIKEQFDVDYDNAKTKSYYDELKLEVERQAQLNKSEFDKDEDDVRVQVEGFRPGMYVRVEIETVPCEMITNLDPTYPIIIGGLLENEANTGHVQARIKKHRWYSKILKSKDPLIFSVGWRRFQTLPIYSKLEDNFRHRMLKYTPEHVACMCNFWGPITPPSTGILAIQDVATRVPGFRIAATGSIVELDKSSQIVKKLKLTGVPLKIYKKTAFIKDMFNSALEVAKFEGAKIKTVSGIRGQIKKAISKPEGCFRATFEDKILLSDIVFCRTWYKIDVPKFYNPVTSLLLPPDEKNQWRGMKTTGQLKREKNIHTTVNKDHLYTPIRREPKVFKPLTIPRTLQKELPYRDKPKLPTSNPKTTFEKRRVAVVREPHEEQIARVMKMIRTNYAHKQEKLKEETKKRVELHKARMEAEEARKLKKQKELKKGIFRDLSKLEKKNKNR